MFGNFFGKILGKGQNVPQGEQAQMEEMMKRPEVQNAVMELQKRLSPADQKQLFRLAMSRNPEAVQKFLKEKVPDWEEIMKGSIK